MRKYRGLTKDGEWVYGWYAEVNGKHYVIPNDAFITHPREFLMGHIEVIPKTVGQQIGKLDINRKEIYDKDIVKWENSVYQQIWEVREITGGWEIASLPKSDDEPRTTFELTNFHQPLEIIGNIHQPELMEKP